MPEIICVDCGAGVVGDRQRRRCDACRLIRNRRRTVRTLAPGEQVPSHEPGRYPTSHGYVLLRWKVGTRSYVETYEHRVIDGRVTTEEHVHHVNRDRADNRPENLRPLTAVEHAAAHAPGWHGEAAHLYRSGLSTYEVGKRLNRDPSGVWRALVKLDVPIRKEARVAVPHRERDRD